MTVIRVEHLSKQYRLGLIGGGTLRADLERWWAMKRGGEDPLAKIGESEDKAKLGERFWALRDVSFEVKQGEVLGIIGRNGAGKSTLLKILSRVTSPTSGAVKMKGRVGSLLEVGTGFHGELTGRENTYLNGAILGMTRREVSRKLDEIIAFAEIEKFIDTPVKRYSSGMYVRLAFAVAAHLDPEILIVDEVLAVGDAAFQKKCLGKMGEVSREGRTVLFVSHNMASVAALTTHALHLDFGSMVASGLPSAVIDGYLTQTDRGLLRLDEHRTKKRPGPVVVDAIRVNGQAPPRAVMLGAPIRVELEVESKREVLHCIVSYIIRDKLERTITAICSADEDVTLHLPSGRSTIVAQFDNVLAPGSYVMDIGLNEEFLSPPMDQLRDVSLATVVLGAQHEQDSFTSSRRTWGAVHIGGIQWTVTA